MGNTLVSETQFAPGQRSRVEDIIAANLSLTNDQQLTAILDAMPLLTAILDGNRHIIYANKLLADTFGGGNLDTILGTRPGEMVNCIHAWDNEQGCGTSIACRFCGAVAAILAAQKGRTVTRECRITTSVDQEPLDLRIKASPFVHGDDNYTIFVIENIADQNRRKVLEKTFFHDIMNTAGNILGISDLAATAVTSEEAVELMPLIHSLATQLISEIQAQRDILRAENSSLEFTRDQVEVVPFLTSLANNYRNLDFSFGKKIILDRDLIPATIYTGPVLLGRILGNMLKNALEASDPGETVTLGCDEEMGDGFRFWVRNASVMTEEVQQQVFQRSFSTKGPGRGIGTYSIKLLGERFLQGRVSFVSTPETGTIFSLVLPNQIKV